MNKTLLLLILFYATALSTNAQELNLNYKGFLDLRANYNKNHSGFSFTGLDNYITSQLSDKLSFAGEIAVEPEDGQNFKIDVERIHITYEFNENFKIRAGRFYAPIGYYTTHFYSDNAATLTPSINRPSILAYEDDGGLLETRATGLMVSASDLTALHINYDLAITNGLGSNSADDNDNNKAITMRLSINPIEGLTLGGGTRFDKLDPATLSRASGLPIGETLITHNISAFAAYTSHKLTLIAEYYSIANTTSKLGTINSDGAFAYAGYKLGKVTPYFQYDLINVSTKDAYYTSANNEDGFDLGLKYTFNYKSVFKTEYHLDIQTIYFQYAISF